ncbi:MAG TPA: MgtC/SapB family protein [bacterium]|nr:MgtC/SapB family protein [bacterium]
MLNELELVMRLVLAAALGGIIGIERESHGREAGFRTMILVCVGNCLVLVISLQMITLGGAAGTFASVPALRLDPSRIAAGALTGIGFLGAGAIIQDRRRIRGLTTAACLWVVTAIGLAVGGGFYAVGLAAAAITLIALYFLRPLEHLFKRDNYNILVIQQAGETTPEYYVRELKRWPLVILGTRIRVESPPPRTELEFMVRYKEGNLADQVVPHLMKLPGVKLVEWK